MNRANSWFSRSGLFGQVRLGKSERPAHPPGRRRFRPVVTGLEDRRLLTNYTLTTLASLPGADQTQGDYGGVTLDAQGNLYGTTSLGGAYDDGMVYEIAQGSNTITALASFDRSNGDVPSGGVVLDGQGNLYGTTRQGGAYDAGTVFEIAAGSSTITTLATFNGGFDGLVNNGELPDAGVVLDSQGNLYGTTSGGGPIPNVDDGTVYEIVKGSDTINTLASFGYVNGPEGSTYPNGVSPAAGVVLDGQGNIYGMTNAGGPNNDGTVYEIVKGSDTINTLVSFNELNQPSSYAGVVVDGQGNLYGIDGTYRPNENGNVFEIAKGSKTISTLASFSTSQVLGAGVLLDAQGNLYGTTDNYNSVGGTVFAIAKGSSTITTLATFNGGNGDSPSAGLGLVLDGQGNFYGTTSAGGAFGGAGTVFELSPQPTPVTMTSSPDPSVYGQSVTLSATVVPSTATGTIIFYEGTTSLGTGTLVNGTAMVATSALAVGSDSITAYYGGDDNDSPGTSAVFTQVVNAVNSQSYSITVNGQAGPWEFVKGGLNTNYSYGVGDQLPPATVTATNGLTFAPGTVFLIQCVSGLEDGGLGIYTDANGLTTFQPANGQVTDHNNFPSYYFDPSDWPAYEFEVVGTFADSNGNIVGTPFNIGDQRAVVVPAGASQLEMGFNDNYYEDNIGSITMEVTALSGMSVTVTSSSNPSVYGQSVTLSATVVPLTSTGVVTFYVGTTSLGTGTLVNGTATLAATALAVGTESITASYGGDANDPPATSAVFNQVVNQDATMTTVTARPSPQYAGQPVTLFATVSASAPGAGTPTGSVTFFDGTTALGTATLSSNGTTTFTTPGLPIGSNAITAQYVGDGNFTGSTSPVVTEFVGQASTTTVVSSSFDPSIYGQSVILSATVTPSTATGTVTFFDGTTRLGSGTLVNGTATLATNALLVGLDAITAFYAGDANDLAGTSPVYSQVVSAARAVKLQSYSFAVNGQSGPWEFGEGGLNTNYTYNAGPMQAPAIVTAADGMNFAPGTVFDIRYVSGSVRISPGSPDEDANGMTGAPPTNNVDDPYGIYPSYYFDPSDWPTYEGEVVGTFADSSGRIVGTPFNIGDHGVVIVPAGASQLEVGINDDYFQDNAGSITMSVTEQNSQNVYVNGQSGPWEFGEDGLNTNYTYNAGPMQSCQLIVTAKRDGISFAVRDRVRHRVCQRLGAHLSGLPLRRRQRYDQRATHQQR